MIEVLEQLGLTRREVEVYLQVVKHNEVSASGIAKHTSVSRTHVYEALQALKDRGLITATVKGRAQSFRAEPLSKLQDLVKALEQDINGVVEELKTLQAPEPESSIKTYQGKGGIRAVYADIIAVPNSEVLIMNVREGTKENAWDEEYLELHRKRKLQRKIRSRYITNAEFKVPDPTGESKYLKGLESTATMTVVYQDKVALIFWIFDGEGRMHIDQTSAVIIKNADNARVYRHHFEELWCRAK